MNTYKVQGQAVRFISGFLSELGYKNIEKVEKFGNKLNLIMKDGTTSQIVTLSPGVRGTYWSIEDFEATAKGKEEYLMMAHPYIESWEDVYDKSLFEEALERMMNKHDANHGINWFTVDYYLEEICLKPQDKSRVRIKLNEKSEEFLITGKDYDYLVEYLKIDYEIEILYDELYGKNQFEEVKNWINENK